MWLISDEAARALLRVEQAGLVPSAEQQREYEERVTADASDGLPRNMTVAGDVAEIRVEGALTKRPTWMSLWFGSGTTYRDINRALTIASSDPAIKSVLLFVDSPGGQVDGLFDTIAALQSFKKPIKVRAANAQSAAFAIASVAGKIEATGPASNFGSIGTAIDFAFWSDIEHVSITNTDSPDKRPDPRTPEGQAVIREYLDAVNDLFVGAIADGRGVTAKVVSTRYGRGATLLAGEAKRRGMIDSIAKTPLRIVGSSDVAGDDEPTPTEQSGGSTKQNEAAGAAPEVSTMDMKTLKAQHPDLFEEVLQQGIEKGTAAGIEKGVTQERKRCCAHIKMAGTTGATEVAHRAIQSGASLSDEEVHAEYMSAALNRKARTDRQDESNRSERTVDGSAEPTTPSLIDRTAAAMGL